MPIDPRYDNPATMKEKREALEQDRTATTYFQRAQNERGQELGRFSHLVKDLAITGLSQPHGGQPPDSYYGINSRLPDEPSLGLDLNWVGDMTTLSGEPRVEGPPATLGSEALPSSEVPTGRGGPSSTPINVSTPKSETEGKLRR
jgi:hypothetical protein